MKIIVFVVGGVWDLLHVGHIQMLEKAKKLGDVLVVGIQADEFVKEEKGCFPSISLKNRITALEALKCVDIVIPYYDYDYYKRFEQLNADILVLTEAHKEVERFDKVVEQVKKDNKRVVYLPRDNEVSSTQIKDDIRNDSWKEVWDRIAFDGDKDDYSVCGYGSVEASKEVAKYIVSRMGIGKYPIESILDFGCGSGVILKHISELVEYPLLNIIGIDNSEGMIKRAILNNEDGVFLVSNHIPYRNYHVDTVISWGVFQYLSNYEEAQRILDEMSKISSSILIMEIPNIERKEEREDNRRLLSLNEFPKHLYYNKDFFAKRGFMVFDNEVKVTKNAEYGFTAVYMKEAT